MGRGQTTSTQSAEILYGRLAKTSAQAKAHHLRGSRQAILLKVIQAYGRDPSSFDSLNNEQPTARIIWAHVVQRFIYFSAVEKVLKDLHKRQWIAPRYQAYSVERFDKKIWEITPLGEAALEESKYAALDWREI